MRNRTLFEVAKELNERNEEYCLIHEAALTSWNLNNSLFLHAIDILVPSVRFKNSVERLGPNVSIRYHASLAGKTFEEIEKVKSEQYDCLVAEPFAVLEGLEESPDLQYLYEQRARLAATLYVHDLSDEDLAVFKKYVRGL